MAGKLKTQEVIIQSPNGLVEKTVTVGNDGVVTIDNINVSSPTLFKEYTVPSNTTSFTIDGLDINTHKSYRIEAEIINGTATNDVYISYYVNGNTTSSNYYSSSMSRNNQTDGGGLGNHAIIQSLAQNNIAQLSGTIQNVGGLYVLRASSSKNYGGNLVIDNVVCVSTGSVGNITSLTISSSVTNAIKEGTKVRIYRGDL